jgi:multidrug efflux pump subunit AcrA (membrane-fusion protein)
VRPLNHRRRRALRRIAANSIGASQAAAATGRALEAHRARQAALQQEAGALQDKSRESYTDFSGQQGQRADELGSYLKQQLQPSQAPAGTEQPISGSNITVQEEAKQRGKASAFAQGQADALGEYRGFGDTLGTLSRAQARDAGQIGQIGGFMSGNSSILPIELDAANQAGNGLKAIGGIAQGLGKLGVSAGLGGGFGGATASTASAAGLPTLATGGAPETFALGSVLSKMPQAALRLGSTAGGLPSFARPGNPYSVY